MPTLAPAPSADLVARLHALYHDASKHSVYQSVPTFMARALGYQEEIHSLWRSDTPRYDYLAQRLQLAEGASIADIGANTGFFTLNLAHARPDLRIAAYELNPRHADYIAQAAAAFALDGVEVRSVSCDLAGVGALPRFDAVLLLNVLHHAGFDFDGHVADDNAAFTAHAIDYLTRLRARARQLVFQIGSNRGGDKGRPLFPRDDDQRRLGWTADALRAAGWNITHLGYAQLEGEAVVFQDAPAEVLAAARRGDVDSAAVADWFRTARLDRFPGEFHRRPLVLATSASL
jgi:SAM-dependent methyltransferase